METCYEEVERGEIKNLQKYQKKRTHTREQKEFENKKFEKVQFRDITQIRVSDFKYSNIYNLSGDKNSSSPKIVGTRQGKPLSPQTNSHALTI